MFILFIFIIPIEIRLNYFKTRFLWLVILILVDIPYKSCQSWKIHISVSQSCFLKNSILRFSMLFYLFKNHKSIFFDQLELGEKERWKSMVFTIFWALVFQPWIKLVNIIKFFVSLKSRPFQKFIIWYTFEQRNRKYSPITEKCLILISICRASNDKMVCWMELLVLLYD